MDPLVRVSKGVKRYVRGKQLVVLERIDLTAADVADAVDVVARVQRAGCPQLVVVHRAKDNQLHHDAALSGLSHEVL